MYQQPMMTNPYMMNRYSVPYQQAVQRPYDALIRVTGIEGARAYQMPANSTAVLFDGNEDMMYVKTTDGAGFPTIRQFSFTPVTAAQKTPETNNNMYVTRKEFEELKEMVTNGKQFVRNNGKNRNNQSNVSGE